MMRSSVLEGLRVRKLADIQWETLEIALEYKDSDLEVNPLLCLQPVKLMKERGDVGNLGDESSGGLHHRK